jgi:SnoaL-like domain
VPADLEHAAPWNARGALERRARAAPTRFGWRRQYAHLFDEGELDRLDELFTNDVVYDGDFGQEPLRWIDAIRAAALSLGAANPVAHQVTNIIITEVDDDTATVKSKGRGAHRWRQPRKRHQDTADAQRGGPRPGLRLRRWYGHGRFHQF